MTIVDIQNLIDSEGRPLWQTLVDEVDASTTYVGYAPRGTATSVAAWYIFKIAVSGTLTTEQAAPLDSIWDNRTSLTYS